MDVFSKLYQGYKSESMAHGGQESRGMAREAERDLAVLQRRVDFLTIASQALWELVRERLEMTDEQILERIQEVDLRDGKADGKISKTVLSCPQCLRNNQSGQDHCIYCGTPLPPAQLFEKA